MIIQFPQGRGYRVRNATKEETRHRLLAIANELSAIAKESEFPQWLGSLAKEIRRAAKEYH